MQRLWSGCMVLTALQVATRERAGGMARGREMRLFFSNAYESYRTTHEIHRHVQAAKQHLEDARVVIMWFALLIATAIIAFKLVG
jgi:hypothetical protein